MSHHVDSLSKSNRIQSINSSVVKNLEIIFNEQLPLVKRSSHPDLQRISSQTLLSLLDKQINNLLIIDARYPFEYAGGHIISAQNIYTDNDLQLLFTKLIASSSRPSIIIFHCEFSSERAPHLCRLFRSLDRQYNIKNYPYLTFPSIYLLDGGYADFYNCSSCHKYCEPKSYISMFEQNYTEELKMYRHEKKFIKKKLIQQQGPIQFCMS